MCSCILNLPDILLLIAEHADLPTLSALVRTSKHAWRLILAYEGSITATRLRTLLVPPAGDVLSTRDVESREILPRLSLKTAREFHRREQRISDLVRDDFLAANNTIPAEARAHYLARLERAAHLCDHMSDLCCSCGAQDLGPHLGAREAQVDFIKSLSIIDLAFLWELAWMGSIGWARSRGTAVDSDPDSWYKSLAFEELVLRQGSLFLWGYALGSRKFHMHADKEVLCGASEIRDWEMGQGHQLPSLRQAVIRSFMSKKGCRFRDVFREMAAVVARCR